MINRILSFFGLTTIKRARKLTTELHIWYVRTVIMEIILDFGAQPAPGGLENAETWWCEQFDSVISHNSDYVNIVTPPGFENENLLKISGYVNGCE